MHEFLRETVQRNMTRPARTVAPGLTIGDLLRLLAADDVEAYPVESNERLVGIVSRADTLKGFALRPEGVGSNFDDQLGTTVDEIMSRRVLTVELGVSMQQVIDLMSNHQLDSLPVVDVNDRLLGVIARQDVVRALARCVVRCQSMPNVLPLVAPAVGYYSIA